MTSEAPELSAQRVDAVPAGLVHDDEIVILLIRPSLLFIPLACLSSVTLIAIATLALALLATKLSTWIPWEDTHAYALGVVLAVMGGFRSVVCAVLNLVMVSVGDFLMMGPYSFLAGACALDLGGKEGSSTAAGLLDSVGYFGASLSGYPIAVLAQRLGWNAVFISLAVVALITLASAVFYRRCQGGGRAENEEAGAG